MPFRAVADEPVVAGTAGDVLDRHQGVSVVPGDMQRHRPFAVQRQDDRLARVAVVGKVLARAANKQVAPTTANQRVIAAGAA